MRTLRTTFLLAVLAIPATAGARVFVRWTEPLLPPAHSLGVRDIVVKWSSHSALMNEALRQGYRVYVTVDPDEASTAAGARGVAGIFVKAPNAGPVPSQLRARALALRKSHPSLAVRWLRAGGKQPQIRGSIAVLGHHIRAISSYTAQPWIDSNVALIRFARAYDPGERPLYDFEWDLIDPGEQKYGPPTLDYQLAVAEAGSFQADLVLPLDPNLQIGLARGNAGELKEWRQIERYIHFYSATPAETAADILGNVGVVTNDYAASYEAVNLMARHNIPFHYIKPEDLSPATLKNMALLVAFGQLGVTGANTVRRFVEEGGVAMLVGGGANYSSLRLVKKNDDSAVYAAGKGEIAAIEPPVVNPEAFARDVWRLLPPAQRELRFWNALTTLAAAYRHDDGIDVNLVNYSGRPLRVQGRVRGLFSKIQVETPERGCCESITPVKSGGFTEFIIPAFRVGARVRLRTGGSHMSILARPGFKELGRGGLRPSAVN